MLGHSVNVLLYTLWDSLIPVIVTLDGYIAARTETNTIIICAFVPTWPPLGAYIRSKEIGQALGRTLNLISDTKDYRDTTLCIRSIRGN